MSINPRLHVHQMISKHDTDEKKHVMHTQPCSRPAVTDGFEHVPLIRMSVQQVSDPGHTADEVLLDEDEEELRKALALSRRGVEVEDEEADLRRAIQLSMLGTKHISAPLPYLHLCALPNCNLVKVS